MSNHQEDLRDFDREQCSKESERARYEAEAGLGEVFDSVDDLMNHLNA